MLTHDFKEMIRARADRDPQYRREWLADAVAAMLSGDEEQALLTLRAYVNATIGFPDLAKRTGIHQKFLLRMLSRRGNPKLRNMMCILTALQKADGIRFQRILR